MAKYKVAISGWAVIEVEAKSAEEAEDFDKVQATELGGELYDLEVHEVVLADDPDGFTQHTDLN